MTNKTEKDVVYFKGKPYTGSAVFINGFNGYTSAKGDGALSAIVNNSAFDSNGQPNQLTDSKGKPIINKDRRGQYVESQNGRIPGSLMSVSDRYKTEARKQKQKEYREARKAQGLTVG